jgi:hypothetical protein
MVKKVNTKLILAGAFFAALVFPFIAGAATTTSGNQNVTITIGKAVEVVNPSGAVALGTTTPLVGSTTDRNVDSTATAVTGGHRSNASWTLTTQEVTAGSGMTSKARVQNGCTGAYNEVNASGATSSSGNKNTSNNLEAAITACFRQPVSWADEAGSKTIAIRHVLGNGA